MAAGGFLGPTGQCKPFDDKADGYCRAEGFEFVFWKKLSDAVRDGNPVLATIPSTAVFQNHNTTPIFVPNSLSLSFLFDDVLRKSGIARRDVNLAEAHGIVSHHDGSSMDRDVHIDISNREPQWAIQPNTRASVARSADRSLDGPKNFLLGQQRGSSGMPKARPALSRWSKSL